MATLKEKIAALRAKRSSQRPSFKASGSMPASFPSLPPFPPPSKSSPVTEEVELTDDDEDEDDELIVLPPPAPHAVAQRQLWKAKEVRRAREKVVKNIAESYPVYELNELPTEQCTEEDNGDNEVEEDDDNDEDEDNDKTSLDPAGRDEEELALEAAEEDDSELSDVQQEETESTQPPSMIAEEQAVKKTSEPDEGNSRSRFVEDAAEEDIDEDDSEDPVEDERSKQAAKSDACAQLVEDGASEQDVRDDLSEQAVGDGGSEQDEEGGHEESVEDEDSEQDSRDKARALWKVRKQLRTSLFEEDENSLSRFDLFGDADDSRGAHFRLKLENATRSVPADSIDAARQNATSSKKKTSGVKRHFPWSSERSMPDWEIRKACMQQKARKRQRGVSVGNWSFASHGESRDVEPVKNVLSSTRTASLGATCLSRRSRSRSLPGPKRTTLAASRSKKCDPRRSTAPTSFKGILSVLGTRAELDL